MKPVKQKKPKKTSKPLLPPNARRNQVDPINLKTKVPKIEDIQKARYHKPFADYDKGEVQLLVGFGCREISKMIERGANKIGEGTEFVQKTILLVCDETREVGKAIMVKRLA